VEEVAKLKQQSGKDMLISGSISLAQSVIDAGMVDEYRLVICPVVLGSGRPLFRDNMGRFRCSWCTRRRWIAAQCH